MSSTSPPIMALMQPPLHENGRSSGKHTRDKDKEERSRSRSKDYGREKDREKEKKKRDRSRERRKSKERKSDKRDRDRESRSRRSRSRTAERDRDNHRRRRSRSKRRDKDRSRSRSYEKRRRDHSRRDRDRSSRDRDRSSRDKERRSRDKDRHSSRDRAGSRNNDRSSRDRGRSRDKDRGSRDRDRSSRDRDSKRDNIILETIKEESRDSRFDLTQTIQELMANTASSKNFAALFNCTNSNDSCSNGPSENSFEDGIERKRRKKSRWGGTENDKTFIPGMPTILPSTLDPTQQEAYLVQLQIEEISRKLRTGDLGIPQNPEERSPSPEPIYSSDGKRLNTREFRFRKRLEEQRHQFIQKMQSVNPEFKPPSDYKPPVTRVSDKVLIPQEQHPDINFVGLLIGPRGNTLKAMEKETGAKIIIRGKGSVKEGKVGRKDGQPLPGEDEPLHAFITAPNPEAVKKAVDKIKDVIRQGIEVPEGHNDLRRMQLRELAQLNGTLRETDCQRCTNCGSTEHKSWLCPDKPNVTNSIVCTSCGGAGHISKDCRSKRPGASVNSEQTEDSQAKIDEEYMSLMAELGEGPPPQPQQPQKAVTDPLAQVHLNRGYSLFDKKPSQPQAIQAAPPPSQPPPVPNFNPMHTTVAPPPPIPGWGGPPTSAPIPPMLPPAPPSAPPPPAPMMPWMSASQPPPPGGEPPIPGTLPPPPPPGTTNLQPPGTGPMPPLIPPPPWSAPNVMPPSFGGWGGGGFIPPPPPGIAPPPPPPGMGSITQPPPPPPPSN